MCVGKCGMSGMATSTGIVLNWEYTYGCENIFQLNMTYGDEVAPDDTVANEECTYNATWAGLSACHNRILA